MSAASGHGAFPDSIDSRASFGGVGADSLGCGVFPDFLDRDADYVASHLLGCLLIRYPDNDNQNRHPAAVVRIVETEAYDQDDQASHAFHGKSERNKALFGPSGHAYIYQIHGRYFCMNISCGQDGYGAGALIRAVEPVSGIEFMRGNRPVPGVGLTNGPAKLCQALGIDKSLYGHDLHMAPLEVIQDFSGCMPSSSRMSSSGSVHVDPPNAFPDFEVAATARIGISHERDRLRRFIIVGNPYISRPSWTAKHLHALPPQINY